MKQDNSAIYLSGQVFVDRLLALEHPGLALPKAGTLRRGDLKLIAVAKSGHPHYKQGCCPSFAGFFAAYIFDGKRWRKFALRDGAAVEATYSSSNERRSKLHNCVKFLRALQDQQAVWGVGTFTVVDQEKHLPPAAGSLATVPAAQQRTSSDTPKQPTLSRKQLLLF